jgi:hypothetical protein
MRLLNGARKSKLAAERVLRALVVKALLRPRAHDDFDLLREEREALLAVEERKAVRLVLAFVPPGSHPDLDAPL